jgi:arabinogalactan oligomer/maltooligosaccharide transport system permease protein
VLIPAPDVRRTLMVGMYSLANNFSIPWGLFAAGSVMTIIPVILVYTYFQKYLVGGLTLGGVKG